jgi:ElaB/YqjD/DUF883 family membrane-anchored ribosome-binding protein
MANDRISKTRDELIEDTDILKQDAGQVVTDIKNHASAHVDAAKDKASHVLATTSDFVKKHPIKLGAIALAIGFIAGSFRRNRPSKDDKS